MSFAKRLGLVLAGCALVAAVCVVAYLVLTRRTSTDTTKQAAHGERSALALPSFSIFEASRMWPLLGPDEPLNVKEIEELMAEVGQVGAAADVAEAAVASEGAEADDAEDTSDLDDAGDSADAEAELDTARATYPFIPLVLYRSRHLFEKDAWSADEIELGRALAQFLATTFEHPDLEIKTSDPTAFRTGLERIRDWYAALCRDNKALARMIFTMDDGPFQGTDVDESDVSAMQKVNSVLIPGTRARLTLLRRAEQDEPMVIAALTDADALVSAVGLSGRPNGTIKTVEFADDAPVEELKGFGYKVSLIADWTYGKEYMHLYLDGDLKVRFYYVSW